MRGEKEACISAELRPQQISQKPREPLGCRKWDNEPMPPTEPIVLTTAEARVLGALMEKETTTPDYYPMSLNALVNACNQRSNREPVMDLDEETVRQALHGLEDLHLAGRARSADGRVAKYEHWLGEVFNFSRAESALVCVLLLRGPQTPGELRGRTERMHRFEEIADVLAGLEKLMAREPALAAVLPRQPGTKESRYAHLLSSKMPTAAAAPLFIPAFVPATVAVPAAVPEATFVRREAAVPVVVTNGSPEERIAQLEAEMAELRREMAALRQKIDDLFGD
jgi:uncharacterized protein YceH (UPF0502 family)